jgi:uncharacterized protein
MSNPSTPPARPVALVTGASAGLGRVFAERLAARGYDLVLVARRAEKLAELEARLSKEHGARCLVISQDLTEPGAAEWLHREVAAKGWTVELLVNNAGFGHYGAFVEQDAAALRKMVAINVEAVAELALRFGKEMAARRKGTVINVASGAGFIPTPYFGLYGATKAFVISFSQSLAAELEEAGVRVLCVCPGATATEFHGIAAGQAGADARAIPEVMTAEQVVDESLRALDKGKWMVVPGMKNLIQSELPRRLLSGRMAARIAMRKMRDRIKRLAAPSGA